MLTDRIRERDENIVSPNLALLIFMKFFSSVIPTINFDFTSDLVLDNQRSSEEEKEEKE